MATDSLRPTPGGSFPYVTHLRRYADAQLNRGLPDGVTITLRVWWPLVILPFAVVNQILAPHAVWLVLVVVLSGLYGLGLLWVRDQAPRVRALRERTGTILVAGDTLREDFELQNESRIPVLWAEFVDESDLPGHPPGRIVACGPYSIYRWNTDVVCERRGVFRLGPHRLIVGDPFGLFTVEVVSRDSDMLLIYPRVVHLPELELPHGNAGESRQRRRPLRGVLPSASVSEYRPGDSLRHIHWRSTARRSRLMVKELEIEPSGDVWVVLDLNEAAHQGEGAEGTLEHSVIVAASIAAKLLSGGERRAVGLLAVSGQFLAGTGRAGDEDGAGAETSAERDQDFTYTDLDREAVLVPPQPGQAQLWRILSALAPVEPTNVTLAELLHNSREVLGGRRTLVVVTAETDVDLSGQSYEHHPSLEEFERLRPIPGPRRERSGRGASPLPPQGQASLGAGTGEADEEAQDGHVEAEWRDARQDWLSELVHLRSSGLDSTVLLVAPAPRSEGSQLPPESMDTLRALLASEEIGCQVLHAGEPLRAALTFRRTRTVVRTTPTGGVVAYDVEEEVG